MSTWESESESESESVPVAVPVPVRATKDDGRMPIMCGHKVMKIVSDFMGAGEYASANSWQFYAAPFSFIQHPFFFVSIHSFFFLWLLFDLISEKRANDTILCGQYIHMCPKGIGYCSRI